MIKLEYSEDFCYHSRSHYYEKLRQLDKFLLIHCFNLNDLVLFLKALC